MVEWPELSSKSFYSGSESVMLRAWPGDGNEKGGLSWQGIGNI